MHSARIEEMVKGWFVGDFEPSLYKTNQVEVGIKEYQAGEYEEWHYHEVATEMTAIISGKVEMNGTRYVKGDVIVVRPGEGTDFRAITETVNVVVKIPGLKDDKYFRLN